MAKRHISLPNGSENGSENGSKKQRIVEGLEGLLKTVQTWSQSKTAQEAVERSYTEDLVDRLRLDSERSYTTSEDNEAIAHTAGSLSCSVERSSSGFQPTTVSSTLRKDTTIYNYCILTERGIPWCRYCGTTKASCFSNGPWKDEAGKVIPRVLCQACMCKICPPKSLSKSKCKEMVEEVSHFLKSLPVEPINPAANKEKVFKKGLLKKLNALLENKEKPDNIVDTFWEWAYKENPERLGRTLMVNYMRAWAKSL